MLCYVFINTKIVNYSTVFSITGCILN